MKEKREVIKQIADLVAYKIRSGELSQEGGEKVWRLALKEPDKVDAITEILYMDLPEDDTLKKIDQIK